MTIMRKMRKLPWRAFLAASCLATYFFILQFIIFDSKWSPQHSFGVYKPIFVSKNETIDVWDKCDLPKFDIWDDELIPHLDLHMNPKLLCDRYAKNLTFLKDKSWGIGSEYSDFKCKARCHWRKNETANIIGKWSDTPGPVNCEVLEAVCEKNGVDVYGYLHTQILPTPKSEPKVQVDESNQYDVTVIVLDSLSHSQAKRSFTQTLSYMTGHMQAVVFPYVNRIGENSFPNGVALLFGKIMEKLDKSLLKGEDIPSDWSLSYACDFFKDNETSLFSEFRDHGYKTLFAEDWANGFLNWPDCKAFNKSPVDHNMRPFQNALERKKHGLKITKQHLNDQHCRDHHDTLLEYLGQFITAYPDQKKFSLIWASKLGHDSENGFFYADHDFHSFLLKYRAQLENSFVFLMGDHGLRIGEVRETVIGGVDVNNPFLAVSIPKKLRETTQILDLMKKNAQSLQSHFDTRATMLDILKLQPLSNFSDTAPLQMPNEKGNSLIRRQPDGPRNCRTMPIPLQYCLCMFNKTNLETNTTTASFLGLIITKKVNQEISDGNFTSDCMQMKLKKVTTLRQFNENFNGLTLYTVEIEMEEPSSAVFRANIKTIKTGVIEVDGMVERRDKYGKTADCIKSEYHRPYCYCKIQPEE